MSEWAPLVRRHLAGLRLDGSREAEIVEELSQHLAERYDALRLEGHADLHARELAMAELLTPGALADHMTSLRQASFSPAPVLGARGPSRLREAWQDVRFGWRMLRRSPVFTFAAVLTLALGIGANGAIFALVDATLLRPLPVPDADRVVMLWDQSQRNARGRASVPDLFDWNDQSEALARVGAFVPNVGGMVMGNADGLPDTVARQWVTWDIFGALGIEATTGRTFSREDDEQRRNLVVLSEPFWRERFQGDPGVVGRSVTLDGDPYTIVGVVPASAQVIGRSSLWALIPITGAPPEARGSRQLVAVGRLAPAVTVEAAQTELTAVSARLAAEYPATNSGRSVRLESLRDVVVGSELRQTSFLFVAVVGLVLLLCCANVANLLMTRATVRRPELVVRAALGADRGRIVRQLMTESLMLACLGGVLGLLVGAAILRAAPLVVPEDLLPPVIQLTLDGRVIVFCAAAALLVGVLFGAAPAWQAVSWPSANAMAGRTVVGRGGRLRNLLVAGQVAVAVVLLIGAGLLLRTLLAVERVDRGYRSGEVLSLIVDPMSSTYPTDEAELQFYEAVEREILGVPGVGGVAWATTLPLGPSYEGTSPFRVEGTPAPADGQRPAADMQIVSANYFDTLGVPVLEGRAFDERDVAAGVPVCIVNEAFVRRHLPDGSPIGRRVAIWQSEAPRAAMVVREIVGVARQVKGTPTEVEDLVQVYVPIAQDTPGDVFLLVVPREGSAAALTMPVRRAIGRVDTAQLVSVRSAMTLDDVAAVANARHRFRAVLVVAFAGLAFLLAMVGLSGILAYSVQQRVRDFGVRRALGASTAHVLGLVAGNAAWVIAGGVAAGLAASALLGRLIATMLFGVAPSDPVTYGVVAAVIALGALASAIGPAWRAARVAPATALRSE